MEAKAGSSLGWVTSCRSVEARGRWGLRAAASGARPKLAEGLPLRFGGRRLVLVLDLPSTPLYFSLAQRFGIFSKT